MGINSCQDCCSCTYLVNIVLCPIWVIIMSDGLILFIISMAYVVTLAYFQNKKWEEKRKDIIMGINAIIWTMIMIAALKL